MDLNLHLLSSSQIKLIQDINLLDGDIEGFKSLKSTREEVDLVILDEGTGYGMFEDSLREEEEGIRREIEKEKEKRIRPSEDGPYQEWPSLPNYDNPEEQEPLFAEWDDDEIDFPIFDDWDDDGKWLQEQEWRRNERGEGNRDERLVGFMQNDANSIGGLNNYELLQLDARLGQIKWFRLRLSRSRNWMKNPLIDIKWSAQMMGCYCVRRNTEGKVSSRTVYLFIDIIKAYAHARKVSEEAIIAEIYTHEMFHAYYDDVKSKPFVSVYLNGVREIEEAMTEYGMLVFIAKFFPSYLPVAQADVKNKLSSGKPMLQCYGLGEYLFRSWSGVGLFGNKIFKVYQKISPSPRLGIRIVRKYVSTIRRPMATIQIVRRSMKMLYLILDYFDTSIPTTSTHFSFNGKSFGRMTAMVYEVLRYYADYTKNGFNKMVSDFDNYNSSLYGAYYIFEEERKINPGDINSKYDPKNKITLSDGTVIVPCKIWYSTNGDNTTAFLDKVKELYKHRVLDQSVKVLR